MHDYNVRITVRIDVPDVCQNQWRCDTVRGAPEAGAAHVEQLTIVRVCATGAAQLKYTYEFDHCLFEEDNVVEQVG